MVSEKHLKFDFRFEIFPNSCHVSCMHSTNAAKSAARKKAWRSRKKRAEACGFVTVKRRAQIPGQQEMSLVRVSTKKTAPNVDQS